MSNARLDELRTKFQENPRRYFAPFANELRKTGDATQAIAVCRTHLASQPGHVSGHIVLGQALYEAGEKGEARTVFTAALELDPENLIALRTLGEIAQVNGEFGQARQWYQRLLDADPRSLEVAQLLHDLPEETSAPVMTTPSGLTAAQEPTPKTVHDEVAAAEAPARAVDAVPAPRFHTSYTGAMPAYDPDRAKPQPAYPVEPEHAPVSSEVPFVDLQPSAHSDLEMNALSTGAVAAAPDAVDMVEFTEPVNEPAAGRQGSLRDELLEFREFEVTAESTNPAAEREARVEDAVEPEGPPQSTQSIGVPAEEPVTDTPHAVFAERGFDGPVDEDIGWLTTPSAAYSDLEAAPEDWFAETEQKTESSAPVESQLQQEAPDVSTTASDSWFDEPDGSETIEAVEVASDEFWLPPELPTVTNAAELSPPVAEESQPVGSSAAEPEMESSWSPAPEPVAASADESVSAAVHRDDWAQSEADSAPEPVSAGEQTSEVSALLPYEQASEEPTVTHYEQEPTSESSDVRVIAEAGEEAIFVEHNAGPAATHPDFSLESVQDESTGSTREEAYMSASFENPPVMDSAAVLGHSSDVPDAAPTPMPAPFITETLAELYLQQGFRDEALSIYRQLLDRNPESQLLRERIQAIETTPTVEPAVSSEEATERAASQSVRTFFSRLARRQATSATALPPVDSEPRRAEGGEVPFASAASALANMFAASKPSASDENAASSLAGAFSDPAGRPSRAAERELSLDHLFRDVAPVGSHGANVTLDEFYSTPNASTGSSTEPDEERSDEPGGSDIRQFTAWLEGLRKK